VLKLNVGHAPNSWNRCQRLGRGFDSLDPLHCFQCPILLIDIQHNLVSLKVHINVNNIILLI